MTARDEATMTGRRILVVEDEYFIAKGLVRDVERAGAVAVGPVPTVAEAIHLIGSEPLDGAVLDVNLRGEMAYPVAEALAERGVPFVFATGYTAGALPRRYAAVTRLDKPVRAETLAAALFGPAG